MNRHASILQSIAVEVTVETAAMVNRLAATRGIDAADRGDLIPHEEVMAELDAMIEEHRARCSS